MVEENTDLKNHVSRVLLETPFAILCTVSEDGKPFARWMSPIFATGNLKEVHTLAAPSSRKVAHIKKNPSVSWVFNTPSFDEVIILRGKAVLEQDAFVRAQIWEAMPDKQRTFILENDENLTFQVIRTFVETVEYLKPRAGQTVPLILIP